ncbi:MAG: 4Fe-4S binding protein [archaeon]|nr:4Fe-4S binding protein [archaeon]
MLYQNNQTPQITPQVFFIWIILIILGLYGLNKWSGRKERNSRKKYNYILIAISFAICGLLFVAVPNPVMPIQQILMTLATSGDIILLLPFIMMLLLLLGSCLILGRVFCGFACPLGAIQEGISKFQFKSSIKEQKKVKRVINISSKTTKIIRWVYFIIFIISGALWGSAIIQKLNIFVAFQVIKNPNFLIFGIPVIYLAVILIFSYFFYRPWCRLLCPFGTIASLFSTKSIYKINRTDSCKNCGLCEKICPSNAAKPNIDDGECYLCGRCIDVCPNKSLKYTKN